MQNKPKHIVLSEWLRNKIKEGTFAYGCKLQSENELTEEFQMSRQTVRQSIGTLVNEGLLERRRGSGTYVVYSRTNLKPATKNIGVISTYLDEYIFPGVIKGIDQVLCENGYNIKLGITYNKTSNETSVLSSMLEGGVDGLIIEPTKSTLPNPNSNLYRKIMKQNIPVIFFNGYYPNLDFPYVSMNDYESGKMNTRYLIEKGHTNLFGIFKSDDIQGHFRYSGFVNTIKESGLEFDDNNVIWYVTEDLHNLFDSNNDSYLLNRLSGSTGIVCYNDMVAYRLLETLKRCKKGVPHDFSIVSFDNSELSLLGDVGFTSIIYPAARVGMEVASRLIRMIRGDMDRITLSIPPHIVERNSVEER